MSCAWYPVVLLLALCSLQGQAEQFVEITAEIDANQWAFWYDQDDRSVPRHAPHTIRCVVGDSTWMIESETYVRNARTTWWFTGTNLIENSITRYNPPTNLGASTARSLPIGHSTTRVFASSDGNPGQPVRVADQLNLTCRLGWLAFCSGPVLRTNGHKIYPPSDIWKEIMSAPTGFKDRTSAFSDGLGLPKKLELLSERGELAVQYKVAQSTNVLGRNFPLEFSLVQYRPPHHPNTNSWELYLFAKGRVTAIGPGEMPLIPPEALKAIVN